MERFNWASFHRDDYLHPETPSLKHAVQKEIETKTGKAFHGKVFMLGHVRYLGYCFNPATFYYCYDDDAVGDDDVYDDDYGGYDDCGDFYDGGGGGNDDDHDGDGGGT